MNYTRLFLASLAAFVAYFASGSVVFGIGLAKEYAQYPALYRTAEGIKTVMPIGMLSTFVSLVVVSILYAKGYQGGSGLAEGARFGVLIGIFAVCGFVFHNYVNLNIGLRLTLLQAVAYFAEWVLVGVAIGLVYRPAAR